MFTARIDSPTLEINAPINHVWSILADLDNYKAWNTFVPETESTLIPGDPIVLHVNINRWIKLRIVEEVTQFDPPYRMAWKSPFPAWLIQGERIQTLQPISANRCQYTCHEGFQGFMVPLTMAFLGKDLTRGFADVAYGLKKIAEETV